MSGEVDGWKEVQVKDSGRQKDRQRWERKEWASLVEKHPRRVKASPWGRGDGPEISDLWRGAEIYACEGGSEEQRTPFGPGETPTSVLSPSPCEARKTGGTARRWGGGAGKSNHRRVSKVMPRNLNHCEGLRSDFPSLREKPQAAAQVQDLLRVARAQLRGGGQYKTVVEVDT